MRIVLCCVVLLASGAVAQAQTSTMLSGKMATYNYLFGASWTCKATMSGNQPPGMPKTATATVTFEAVNDGTLHVHVVAPQYAADSYYGYSPKGNAWWSTTADSTGMVGGENSTDGSKYTGTAMIAGASVPMQDIYTKIDNSHTTIHSAVMINGKPAVSDNDCTRS